MPSRQPAGRRRYSRFCNMFNRPYRDASYSPANPALEAPATFNHHSATSRNLFRENCSTAYLLTWFY